MDQPGKISFQRGFPACDAYAVDPATKGLEAAEDVFQRNGGVSFRMEDEKMIMAIRTAKIAAGKKKDGAELSWPIEKGGLQESLDLRHGIQ